MPRRSARFLALAASCSLVAARAGYGQEAEPSQWFTRVAFTPAYVVSTNPFTAREAGASDPAVRAAPSMTFEIGRQTDGSREWHHQYGLPSYGVGVSVATLGQGVSRPVDAYTFFSWPFAHLNEQLQVTTDFGMGLSWNWKAFDPQANTYATVLGSNLNARIDWGFYLRYLATPQTSVYAGVDFTHRSNGGMRQPDQGLNVIGPSVGVRHNFGDTRHAEPLDEPSVFLPSWEFIVGAAGGPKNVYEKDYPELRRDFAALAVTAALQRHFYRFGKVAFGSDLTYDGATGARIDLLDGVPVARRGAFGDRLSAGLYGGYEHVIGRFSAIVQVGGNVANGSADPSPPRLYQRYGWRVHFSDHYWGTFSVRTIRDRRADFIAFGAGYRTRWR